MPQNFDADVAVIGYGPTGVVGALTLAQQGASVLALERDRDIYPRARAVTVNDWTMRIFQGLGIGARVEKVIDPQRALRWVTYDGDEVMRIEHPPSTLGSGPRFYNIYQPTMESELRACAQDRSELISVRYGAEVTEIEQDDSGVTLTTTDTATGEVTRYRTRYAVAADGGSSATRQRLGIPLLGDTGETTWVVIDCRSSAGGPTATSSPSGRTRNARSSTSPCRPATTAGRSRSSLTRPRPTSRPPPRCGRC
ncbi:FAD-dependent monooxygenase [Streptomyces sp. AC1-42W]|uniref:FAD-dependent monooxygenase n=1 Tax=Streptomyces sp. AC1-42W TaxID=2218666 RepID=UPI00237C1AC4|nr:FAD-dependent monooxygenase [Streptomyces sp. AC1-42W]